MKKLFIAVVLMFFGTTAYAYNPANLPEEMLFSDAIEIFDENDITGGYISNYKDKKQVPLSLSDCRAFYRSCAELVLKREINPAPFSGLAVNLYTGEKLHTFFLSSGIQLGLYGPSNYICYSTSEYIDEIHSLYNSSEKTTCDIININSKRDFLKLPESTWAIPQIKKASENSLLPYEFINKYGQNITRAEFCKLLSNMICVCKNYISISDYINDIGIYPSSYFEDCDLDYVLALNSLGIITGKSKTIFEPSSPLTREEAAVILTRAAFLFDDFPSAGYLNFKDNNLISSWAYDSVLWVCGYNIMNGISEAEFSPSGNYTTEQAITTINRLYELIKKVP